MKHSALLLALLCALPCRAESPEDALKGIIERTDAENPEVRESASVALEAWCNEHPEKVEPILAKASEGRSPEARARINAALEKFRGEEAELQALRALDAMEYQSVKGLKFVEFKTGDTTGGSGPDKFRFVTIRGFEVESSKDTITLVTMNLGTQKLARHTGDFMTGYFRAKATCENPDPAPGSITELDFVAACGDGGMEFRGRWGEDTSVPTAVLASWCQQLGQRKLALKYVRQANAAAPGIRDRKDAHEARLALAIAKRGENWLIALAHRGMARAELLKAWKRLAALSTNPETEFCRRMTDGYEAEIRDEGVSPDLSPEELAKLPVHERAEYWIHRLPDVGGDISPSMDPDRAAANSTAPLVELRKMGVEIIPVLISHFETDRPTRSLDWRDSVCPEPGARNDDRDTLYTVGDLCEQLFAEMTGVRLYKARYNHHSMSEEGRASEIHREAVVWYETIGKKTAEEQLVDLLPANVVRASVELIQKFGTKHLEKIVAVVRAKPNATGAILRQLGASLSAEHAELFRAMLAATDRETFVPAAEALARLTGDKSGVEEMLRRLDPATPAFKMMYPPDALPIVAKYMQAEGVDLVVGFLTQKDIYKVQDGHIRCAALFPDPKVLDALMTLLDRPCTETFQEGNVHSRRCDLALHAITAITDWPGDKRAFVTLEARDGEIRDCKAWLAKNRESLDWVKIKARVLAAPPKR